MIRDLIEGIVCYCDTQEKINALYEMQNAFSFAELAAVRKRSDPSEYNSLISKYKHMGIDDRIKLRDNFGDATPFMQPAEAMEATKKYLTKNMIGDMKSSLRRQSRKNSRMDYLKSKIHFQ